MPLIEKTPATRQPSVFTAASEGAAFDLETEFQPPSGSRRKTILVVAGLLLSAAVCAGLIWRYAFPTQAPVFQLARIERGRIDATVAATGACNAVVNVQVGSQVSGNIKALYADFNTRVKAGQLVALIDPQIFEAKVKQAEAAWRNANAALENAGAAAAKAEAELYSAKAGETNQIAAIAKAKVAVADAKTKLARRETMSSAQILSKEDLDTARASYDQAVAEEQAAEAQHEAAVHNVQSAEAGLNAANKTVAMFQAEVDLTQASLNQARIDLEHTKITAPVDGTVIARRMDVGQTVAASFQAPTIFEIAQDLTKMQVDTNVAESDVGRIQVGQPATFTVDAYPGIVFEGRVTQIRHAPINVQNVITYDAVIQVANPDLKLFPGMTANVTILTERSENALKLPNAALRVKLPSDLVEGGPTPSRPPGADWALTYVRTQDSKVHAVPVKIGITDGNFTAVEQGDLREGQAVITGVTMPGVPASHPAPLPGPRRF